MTDYIFIHPELSVQKSEEKGWGVFAQVELPEGLLIERSPVIIMTTEERTHLDQTLLHDYIFEWGEDSGYCAMAMGYVPIYNHASPSNAEYVMNLDQGTIDIITVSKVEQGAEVFINYQGDFDNKKPVWFELK